MSSRVLGMSVLFLAAAIAMPALAQPQQAEPIGAAGPTGYGPSGKLLVLVSKDLIKRSEAERLVQAAVQDCAKRGTPCSAMVMDVNGVERAELSDDLTPLNGLITMKQKAQAVLAFKVSTGALAERIKADKTFADQYGKDGRYFFVGGGVPIYKGGAMVGVLAVGGTHNQDEACALNALKAVAWARPDAPARPSAAAN